MSHTNHVDGEIFIPLNSAAHPTPEQEAKFLEQFLELRQKADRLIAERDSKARVPVEPTDLDYRTAALNAAIQYKGNQPFYSEVIKAAEKFEPYLRGEAA